ncbi:MAG TPA: TM2 domain-containing protein [Candidatus Binataceae bacterium]|jgi:ribosomal protein L37E
MDIHSTADNMIFGEDPMDQTCERCGGAMPSDAIFCSHCGERVAPRAARSRSSEFEDVSERSRLIALLLCLFLGYFGVHRFYVGKIGTGVLWLLTGGLFGIGYVVDAILIAVGSFRDSHGLRLVFWDDTAI